MVLDPDLELGYFGILAQKGGSRHAGRAAPAQVGLEPAAAAAAAGRRAGRSGRSRAGGRRSQAQPAEPRHRPTPRSFPPSRPTRLGLAGRVIVITVGRPGARVHARAG